MDRGCRALGNSPLPLYCLHVGMQGVTGTRGGVTKTLETCHCPEAEGKVVGSETAVSRRRAVVDRSALES